MTTDKTKLALAAGFFEGEGSICLHLKPGYRDRCIYFYLKLTVGQTERAQLEELQRLFGGSVNIRKKLQHRKQSWAWSISGEAAIAAYKMMEPYFVGAYKRQQFQQVMRRRDQMLSVA